MIFAASTTRLAKSGPRTCGGPDEPTKNGQIIATAGYTSRFARGHTDRTFVLSVGGKEGECGNSRADPVLRTSGILISSIGGGAVE